MKTKFYSVEGKGQPIVFINGWAQSRTMWEKQINFLSKRFKLISCDFPGFGESGYVTKIFKIQDYSDYIIKILDELNIKNPIIISHSIGCKIALDIAKRIKVDRIIVVSGNLGQGEWYKKLLVKIAIVIPGLFYYLSTKLFSHYNSLNRKISRKEEYRLLKSYLNLINLDFNNLKLHVNKLDIIQSKNDRFVNPKFVNNVNCRCPIDIHLLEKGGHFPNIYESKKFNKILKNLLFHD